jgi:hypothetical protein
MQQTPAHTPSAPTGVVGYLTTRTVRGTPRLALMHANGRISNTFGLDESREYVAGALAERGLELRADNSVQRIPAAA